jgi:hypothetical protein
VQVVGAVLGGILAVAVLLVGWRRRREVLAWIATRPRQIRIAMAAAALVVILAGAGAGAVSWNYMQHDNGFCTGCHVMAPAFERFTASEHNDLSCHDCHQQSIFASMRQLYLWVAERPDEIGAHAPVANVVCERCHVTGQAEVWQRIASTAGHRMHLESDSSALNDVMCVTCHGLEVHQFAPVNATCAQSGCHESLEIAIGGMESQTTLHCVLCHAFTAEVPALATWDSAAGTLVPGMRQCFSCHEMQQVLAGFEPARDPHQGTCGMCHNPHEQSEARAAASSCTTAQCHVDWRDHPFHVGPRHLNVGQSCTVCHTPHQARVDASDCVGCHRAIVEREDIPRRIRQRLQRVLPFDTAAAAGRIGALPWRHDGASWTLTRDSPAPSVPVPLAVLASTDPAALADLLLPLLTTQPDTFSHRRHESLSCLSCHSTQSGHGRLTFEVPRGCNLCHHQAPATSDCRTCHSSERLSQVVPVTVRVAVEDQQPRDRGVGFAHEIHADASCVSCHTTPVSLAPLESVARCISCHEDHHAADRTCSSCHESAAQPDPHAPPANAHVRCDACHRAETVTRLLPDRSLCLTCHAAQIEHFVGRECTTCHMLATPREFRARLTGGA